MGRPRTINTDLPSRLYFNHGSYFYVMKGTDKKSEWLNFGTSRAKAIARARRLNLHALHKRAEAQSMARAVGGAVARHVLGRDGYKCVYCGATEGLGIDHFIPYSQGGSSMPFNLVACCESCNGRKSDKSPGEYVLTLMGMKEEIMRLALAFFRREAGKRATQKRQSTQYGAVTIQTTP